MVVSSLVVRAIDLQQSADIFHTHTFFKCVYIVHLNSCFVKVLVDDKAFKKLTIPYKRRMNKNLIPRPILAWSLKIKKYSSTFQH